MLKVLRHGSRYLVTNPVDQSQTEMVNVTFVEYGRSGAISSLGTSSDFLSRMTGEKSVGLDQSRVHTQPIKLTLIDVFPIGKEIQGHINRNLFSTPVMRAQENVQSRMVDGKPTFFTTYLDDTVKPDEDYRMSNETLARIDPESFRNARIGVAEVTLLEQAVAAAVAEEPVVVGQPAGGELLGQ